MAINVELGDNFFLDEEKIKMMKLLNATNDEQFNAAITKIVKAAITEYKEMLLGKGMPTRSDEIKQHRLFHMVKHYFGNQMPTEAEISSMFQLTESESRSLLKNVRTRFRYQLEDEIKYTLRGTIQIAERTDEGYELIIQSDNVLEELNRIIAINAPRLDPVRKVKNCARKYFISEDSYALFCDYFGLDHDISGIQPA